ncbi:MAG: hypothetical protein J6X02_03955 [Bacilli bacterium]|nr:hypothetical protein [Bacilli bacterium]
MSKKIIYIGIIITFIGFCLSLLTNYRKKTREDIVKNVIKIQDIKSLSFNYSNGYMMYAYTRYELNCDKSCTLRIKPNGIPDEDMKEYEVDNKTIVELCDLLNKYDISKWNGFDESDQNVLDGDSFSFSLNLHNGKSISASGYMRWPKNYSDVKNGIMKLFDAYIKEGDFNEPYN